METKTKIKIFLSYILLFCVFITQLQAAVFIPNVADFKSSAFNNDLPMSTGNKARVQIIKEMIFSGTTQISDSVYNIADFSSFSFNNGLPVNTGKKAKVVIGKTQVSSGQTFTSDTHFNIADFTSSSFNNGLPVNTGKKAKVVVDNDLLFTASGFFIYGDNHYNIADFTSSSFNNGLPVNTGKKAKVVIAKVIWEDGKLTVEKDTNYNIASFQTDSFNNGLPVSTGKKAKVNFEKQEIFYEDQNVSTTGTPQEIIYTNININPIAEGFSKDYTNSLSYIFQAMYKNNKNINLLDISSNIYNNRGSSGTVVIGDKGLLQQKITHTPDGKKLSYTDNNNFIITDGEIYKTETAILQVHLTGAIVAPPMLTYPYPEMFGTGIDAEQKYVLKTNYPIIKGMAYPNSIMEVTIGSEIYYVKVDNNGLFEFKPSKKIDDGNTQIKFQYTMLEGENKLSINANKKLFNPKIYDIEINSSKILDFPYITSIYNDDYLYTDIFYMEGFANPGVLNYKLTTLTGGFLTQGETIVNNENKHFSFMLGDKGKKLNPGNDYIIEVWQLGGLVERKSFKILGAQEQSIGILNIKDHHILPTTKPTFVGYSKENILNNDTVRVYACDITGNAGSIIPCTEGNRKFLGTTNAGVNGLFQFTPLQALENNKYYEFEFINTRDMSKYKKIVIKTEATNDDLLSSSQVTSLYSGLNINSDKINISGFTLSGATIVVGSVQVIATNNGRFEFEVDFDPNLEVRFIKGSNEYNIKYKLEKSENNINNISSSYYEYFDRAKFNIIDIEK